MIYDDSVATCSAWFEFLSNGYTPSNERMLNFHCGENILI